MDTLSSDIRILIKKASEWPQPHNLDHIKPADGKPCGFSTNQHMPPITDLFPFSEFISKYMNGPFKFHDEPAKKPLLSKLPPFHFQGALEVSKIVILLTTENSLNPAEQRLLSDYISSRSISCQELRDETILQILSQTSGRTFGSPPTPVPPPPPPPPGHLPFANARAEVLANVNNAADHKSWVLLADCLSCVKPSFNFQNYILSYLTSASGDGYEVLCFNKLHQNCSSGEECLRYYPPCLLEKFANQNHCFMALSCSFSDESIGSGQVSSWTLAKEFASSILRDMKNIPANHASGWTVALRDPQGLYECQSDDFVMDLISELEVPASFCSQPANFLVTKFSKTSSGRYIHGEHPHNIQRKRLLLVKPNKHSSIVPRSPYVRRDNSKNKQNIPSKRQPDYESLNASLRSSTIPVMDATHWIDDVFQGALNHESILDSEVIATRIKGGVDDQLNSGMPIMMPQFVPHPYMTQPMMPMILPNPQMMFNPATNPALYQQATSHVDHLFFHVDPQRRKEANDLKVQLETKELEKKVLEMTLQTEVLKQRIQDFQSFPSQQKGQPNRQQTTLPQYSQSFAPPPLKPQIIQDTAKKPLVKSEHIAFESPPILHPPVIVPKQLIDKGNSNLVLQTEDKGDSQNSSETSDSVRKVRKLGKFVWPPEDQEKSKQKPMIKPGKLLIDETKADTVEVIKIPKVPPKPPPKTKPLKLARTDNNLKTKPVDQDVSQKPAATNSDADNFTLSLVKMKLEEIFAKGSASEESTTAELTDFAQQKPPSRGQSLSPFPEISRSTMTYAGVDWVLEIRKEYFSPQEKLEDKTSIDLIYRQVVKDGLSRSCVRLTNECFKELRDVFSKLQITSPVGGSSTKMKLLVIEVAKKLPFYFSKVYPVKNNSGQMEIHQVAVGCEGVTLLTITDELTFEVFHFIKFEEITNLGLRSKTEFVVESGESNFTFYSPKAVEIQDLIEIHKREKLELQNSMEAYKGNLSNNGNFALTSGDSNEEVPKLFSDKGVVMKVHAGSRAILVEILPEMSVVDVLVFICNILGINSIEDQQELVLRFEQGQIWTFLMKRLNAFSATVRIFNVSQSKVGTREVIGETELARGAWINMIDLSHSPPAYLNLLYSQSISDYLCGYFMPITSSIVPAAVLEEISILVALQFQIENPNSTVFEEGVEKYLPRNIWSMVDLDYLCPLVLNQCIAVQNLKSDDKMSLSLEILSKWPMFGSSFFQAKYFTTENSTSECILAIHKHGLYFLNENTNVTMSFCSFKNGIYSTIDNGDEDAHKITLWIGGPKGSDKPSPLPIISRGREHILALLDLYNSLLKM